ncbi:MAG: LLM class F420-dependent oxidoreductase [Acidimicrobiia bacterium]
MHLALSASTPGLSVPEQADLCRFAEDLGYRQAWLAEVAGPDAFVLAGAVARMTKRLEIGVGVVPAYTRTPAGLATAAASVSQMMEGRPFRLGIGASSKVIVEQWHGTPFTKPLTRVRETVEAVRLALAGQGDYVGSTLAMRRFRPATLPAGPLPLYVGALRPGMLALAGELGDGVCLNLMPPRIVPRQLAEVHRGAEKIGRQLPEDFGVMARLQTVVTDDPTGVREMLRNQFVGPYMAQPVYNRFLAWMGYEEEAEAIATGWAAKDRAAVAKATHDRLIDDLVLVGHIDHIRNRLDEFADSGLTVAALMVLTPSRTAVEETLRALAP